MHTRTTLAAAAIFMTGLTGCAPPPSGKPERLPASPPAETGCGADQLGAYVGVEATDDVIATLREWRGDRPMRVILPGMAVTMDYRPDRLNVEVGENGRIAKVRCG